MVEVINKPNAEVPADAAHRGPALVHIGYHKTATTWFQKIYYPRVRNCTYIHRKRVRSAFLGRSALHFDPTQALAELNVCAERRPILCEEELSGNIHSGGLYGCFTKEIAHRLRSTLPDAEIVIFIRNQRDMLKSVYQQYVKEGGTYSANRYLFPYRHLSPRGFQPAKAPLFSFDHFDYHALASHYSSLFGRDRVHIFLFETFLEDTKAFTRRYSDRFGLDVDLETLPESRPNPPYGRLLIPIARALNHLTYRDVIYKRYLLHIPLMYKIRGTLIERANRLPILRNPASARELLGRKNLDYIDGYFADSNQRLAEEFALPLQRYRYPMSR